MTTKPTNATIQVLQRELYANARAIDSTRGGGAHGHLAIIMPADKYLLLAGVAFNAPVHPGNAPQHGAGATTAQITETNRQYAANLTEYMLYRTVNEELKKQILAAVPILYLATLSDDDMGFADVNCSAMLAHLRTTYGTITQAELETNRNRLTAAWPPKDPIEDLWLRIREIQRFATAGGEAISDSTVLRLTLEVLEQTGVFITSTERWREIDEDDWTLDNFKVHFNKANKERRRKLTAQTAGYHGAHAATPIPTVTTIAPFCVVDGEQMFYCWSHGLGRNPNHCSATCTSKRQGHKDNATVNNRMGGNSNIMSSRPRRTTPTVTPAATSS